MDPIINPALGLAIMMNNFLHDIATALLGASAVAMWAIAKNYKGRDRSETEFFLKIYATVTKLAKFSLAWILVGGIPRTLAYRSFEWANAVGHQQVAALIIKHVFAFFFVGGGAYLWLRLQRKVSEIKSKAA
jgi:hypothetical protein